MYLGSNIPSTERDANKRIGKARKAIDRSTIPWKSDLSDKIKQELFPAVTVPVLMYGCTTWILMKRMEKMDSYTWTHESWLTKKS